MNISPLISPFQASFEKTKRENLYNGLNKKDKSNCQVDTAENNLLETVGIVKWVVQNEDHNCNNNTQLDKEVAKLVEGEVIPFIPLDIDVPLFIQIENTFLLLTWVVVEIFVLLLVQDLVDQYCLLFKFGEVEIFVSLQRLYLIDSLAVVQGCRGDVSRVFVVEKVIYNVLTVLLFLVGYVVYLFLV